MNDTSRLRWLCRRGMKELDLLLKNYLEQRYAEASAAQQRAFETLLQLPDPELYDLVLGRTRSNDKDITAVVTSLREA